jgi:uncharacterized protein
VNTTTATSALCGPYEIVAQRDASLLERPDRVIELVAEHRYLVRLGDDADTLVLKGALTVLHGATEGVLHFGNFVGETSLGGRTLIVRSSRLTATAVQRMLDEVAEQLASLPFAAATPTSAPYSRERTMAPDALYHAYAFLRDSMEARGRHDVRGAVERILARPHESLEVQAAALIPLGQASRIDGTTLSAIQSEPELLSRVDDGTPLARHPLARRLRGRMPELIRTRPLGHTKNNRENRFVVTALEAMIDIARRFERFARDSKRPSSTINALEAEAIASHIARWRRHPALESLAPSPLLPLHSTVLRGRAGYRELLRFYSELIARTRVTKPHDLQTLLELRDAAQIYECWCYFRVVAAVSEVIQGAPVLDRFAVNVLGTGMPYRYRAEWGDVEAVYNMTYSRPSQGLAELGRDSYSVRLRPDITVRTADGRLHLFDAKLKVDFGSAVESDDADDAERGPGTFKREDLYKMHAYRDALGADSVWVLYPGYELSAARYRVPWIAADTTPDGAFQGVGAIALRPGAEHDGGLGERIAKIVGGAPA